MENILQDLNEKQIEAVKAVNGPVLIIAGPVVKHTLSFAVYLL